MAKTKAQAEPVKDAEPNPLLHLPKGVLGVAKLAAEESTRYSFNSVQVSRTKNGMMRAAATDGKRAIVVQWQDEFLLPACEWVGLIPADVATRVDKDIVSKGEADETHAAMYVDEKGTLEFRIRHPSAATVISADPATGTFAPLESVFTERKIVADESDNAVQSAIGVDMLIETLQAFRAVGIDTVFIQVPFNSKRPLTLMADENGRAVWALVMPRVFGGDEDSTPDAAPLTTTSEQPEPADA